MRLALDQVVWVQKMGAGTFSAGIRGDAEILLNALFTLSLRYTEDRHRENNVTQMWFEVYSP